MRLSSWNRESRLRLESYLKQGYSLPTVAKMMGVARPTIRAEVKKGITEEENAERRWTQYRASRAIYRDIIDEIGEDNIRQYINDLKREARNYDSRSNR